MKWPDRLTAILGTEHPVIQAPMAGGGTTPELVAAVSKAGGFGFIGAAYLTPEQIRQQVAAVRSSTSLPFGINLFAPVEGATVPTETAARAIRLVAAFHEELGLEPPEPPTAPGLVFEQQFAAVLASGARALSFTFGMLPEGSVRAAHEAEMVVIGTATSVVEALALERAGVDAIVAQGGEAGGHRGTFGVGFDEGMVGTMALVPQVVDAVRVPVVASGGVMDGRGIAAALVLGASGVQMGTAFLTTDEAGIPASYKEAILRAAEHQTRVTRAFSGRPARGIVNRFMGAADTEPDAILPYPLQNGLTRQMRTEAAKQRRPEMLSLWAGQGVRMARRGSAHELAGALVAEAEAAFAARA